MTVKELAVVHLVKVVTGKNDHVCRVELQNVGHHLTYCIGSSLKPVPILRSLFCGENLDKSIREPAESIRA